MSLIRPQAKDDGYGVGKEIRSRLLDSFAALHFGNEP